LEHEPERERERSPGRRRRDLDEAGEIRAALARGGEGLRDRLASREQGAPGHSSTRRTSTTLPRIFRLSVSGTIGAYASLAGCSSTRPRLSCKRLTVASSPTRATTTSPASARGWRRTTTTSPSRIPASF